MLTPVESYNGQYIHYIEYEVESSAIADLGVKNLPTHQSDITIFSQFCNCKSSEQKVGHQGFLGMMTLIPLQSNFNSPSHQVVSLRATAMSRTSTSLG